MHPSLQISDVWGKVLLEVVAPEYAYYNRGPVIPSFPP